MRYSSFLHAFNRHYSICLNLFRTNLCGFLKEDFYGHGYSSKQDDILRLSP